MSTEQTFWQRAPWLATSICAFAFPALSLVMSNGYSIAATALLVCALCATPYWLYRPVVPPSAWRLVLAFVLMAVVWQMDGLRSDGGWREVDKPIKYLAVLPCLFFLLKFPPRENFLWTGIGCGAVASGLRAVYEIEKLHLPRAEGFVNAIQFGDLSLLLGVMCIVGLMTWRPATFRRSAVFLMAAGIMLGLLGSLLSQSRGGWLALVLILPVMAWLLSRFLDRRFLMISGLVALLCSTALMAIAAKNLSERLDVARQEVHSYEATGFAANSVGQRLAHWKAAWRMGVEKPVFGWGQEGYEHEKERMVAAGMTDPFVLKFNHAHNEFLDAFAKRGLLGLGTLLFLYGTPMVMFWPRRCKQAPMPPTFLGMRIVGVLVPVAYIGFGLTQGFLGHNSGTMFFLFMTVLIFSVLQGGSADPVSPRSGSAMSLG